MSEENKKTANDKTTKKRVVKAGKEPNKETVISETDDDSRKPKYYRPERAAKYREYRNSYVKKNVKQLILRFNMTQEDDVELYNFLNDQENMTQYIKTLIKDSAVGKKD